MSPDPFLDLFVRQLRDVHRCEAVIVYGSRARGDFTPESDYDLLGIRDSGAEVRVAREEEGRFLDAFVVPRTALTGREPEYLRLLGGRVLADSPDGFAAALLERVAEADRRGPEPLDAAAREERHAWIRKMVARAGRGDIEARFRHSWLLYELLENYFVLRGRWYRGPKESFAWLRQHDPALLAAYESALAPGAGISELRELAGRVLSDA